MCVTAHLLDKIPMSSFPDSLNLYVIQEPSDRISLSVVIYQCLSSVYPNVNCKISVF